MATRSPRPSSRFRSRNAVETLNCSGSSRAAAIAPPGFDGPGVTLLRSLRAGAGEGGAADRDAGGVVAGVVPGVHADHAVLVVEHRGAAAAAFRPRGRLDLEDGRAVLGDRGQRDRARGDRLLLRLRGPTEPDHPALAPLLPAVAAR